MYKFLLGCLAGSVMASIVAVTIINDEKIKSENAGYDNGFESGYGYGDGAGFKRCYDNRQDFPFYTPEESSKF